MNTSHRTAVDHGWAVDAKWYIAAECLDWLLRKGDQLITGRTKDIPVTQTFADADVEEFLRKDQDHPSINSTLTFITSRDDYASDFSWSPDTKFFAKVSCEWDSKRFPKSTAALRTPSTGSKT